MPLHVVLHQMQLELVCPELHGFGAPPQEAATTAEGQSAGTITLPHGEFHEATSLPPFASRPPSATEPFHEIQSAEQHDDQG